MAQNNHSAQDAGYLIPSCEHSLFTNAPLGIIMSTPDGRILSANPAIGRMFGYDSPDELIDSVNGMTTQLYAAQPDREEIIRLLRENDEVFNYECRGVHRNGAMIWTSINVSTIRDYNGEITHFQSFISDITQRKQMEEELQQSEELLRTVTTSIPGMLYQFRMHPDGAFDFPYMSEGVRVMFGISPEEATNDVQSVMGRVHEEDLDALQGAIMASAENMTPYELIHRHRKPNGEVKWIKVLSTPKEYEDGSIVWNGVALDITEQKAIEAKLAKRNIALENAERLTGLGSWEWNMDDNELHVSKNWLAIHGSSNPNPTMEQILPLAHPDDVPAIEEAFVRAMESGDPYSIEHRIIRQDTDEVRWVRSHGEVRSPQGDQIQTMYGAVLDITESVQDRQALVKSEKRLRALFEASSDIIYFMNPDCSEMLQLHGGEFISDTLEPNSNWLKEYIYPDDQQRVLEALHEAIRTEDTFELQHRIIRGDGSMRWVYSRAVPVHNDAGKIEEWFGAASDITTRKQAEEALQLSETRFRNLIEGSPDAISINVDEVFVYVNDSAVDLFGADSKEQLLGQPRFQYIHPNYRNIEKERFRLVTQEEKHLTMLENVYLRQDGKEVPVEFSVVPLVYNNQTGAVFFTRDISDRKALEENRRDIERICRHDLKTPLCGMQWIPQTMLSDKNLTEKQRNALQQICTSSQRMMDIIDMSLKMFQIEKGKYQFEPNKVDIIKIINDIHIDIDNIFKTMNSHLCLFVSSEKENKNSFFVLGEELLFYEILSNLIKNAVENVQYGQDVKIYLEEFESYRARITIYNPGTIPDNVYKSFGQKYITSGQQSGTGLGVYSSRLIANAMHGSFNWTSSESGTYIFIEFPKATE